MYELHGLHRNRGRPFYVGRARTVPITNAISSRQFLPPHFFPLSPLFAAVKVQFHQSKRSFNGYFMEQ
jgi:hypothetical protein